MVEFSPDTMKEFQRLLSRYPRKEAAMLPALRLLEREFGEVNEEGMKEVARLLDVSPAKVFGVFTFYTHFRRPGTGKYLLQVCSTLSCALRHSEDLFDHCARRLAIENGETTPDKMFTLKKVECLASCGTAPVIQVNDAYHEEMTPEKLDALIERLKRGERADIEEE